MSLEGNITNKQTLEGDLSAQYGTRGQSAYEVAVSLGFEGTEEEWLASLKGEKGEQGDKGEQGIQGIQGEKGDKGDKGEDAIAIINSAVGKTILLTDSANAPIVNLKANGESWQNGTSTMDSPVDVESLDNVEDKVFEGKNIFNGEIGKYAVSSSTIAYGSSYVGFICPVVGGQTYTVSRDSASSSRFAIAYTEEAPANAVPFIEGTKVMNHSALTLTSYAPPEAKYLVCFLSASNEDVTGTKYQVEIGDVATEYEPYKEPQTLTIPHVLRGVTMGATIPKEIQNSPIHMNGVYWNNARGQYYIGDYISTKTKQKVQVICEDVLKGDRDYVLSSNNSTENYNSFFSYYQPLGLAMYAGHGLSTHFMRKNGRTEDVEGVLFGANSSYCCYSAPKTDFPDAKTFKAYLKQLYDNGTPVISYFVLAEPIVTELTDEEVESYKQAHTNYPTTTILSNAELEVEYVADTKNYIDNKFKELSVAIISQ